jgi:TPR repeat protein
LTKAHDRINELYVTGKEKEALAEWQKLAVEGDVEAMATLGGLYWEDFDDYPESIKWFSKAIAAGDTESQYFIAFPYAELGEFKLAEQAFLRAIKDRRDDAVIDLAKLYIDSLQSPDQAEKLLVENAKLGLAKAKLFLVDFYLERDESDSASIWIHDLKTVGLANEKSALARVLRKHLKFDLAIAFVQQAADGGDIHAQAELLTSYEESGNLAKAKNFLDQIISQSKKPALYSLACALDQGELARKTVYSHSAERIFTHLAESGNKNSYLRLANLILRDKSQDRIAEALPWFTKAAEGGSRPAQVRLCLLASTLGESDLFEFWFQVALSKGLPGQNREFGAQLRRMNNPEAALRAFQYEYENGRKSHAPEYAVALWQVGRFGDAQKVIQHVLADKNFMFGSLATEFMNVKNYEKAIEFLLSEQPEKSFNTCYRLSYSYWRLGNTKDSEKYLTLADSIARNSSEESNMLSLGMMNYRLGHIELARNLFLNFTEKRKKQRKDVRLIDLNRGLDMLGAACFALAEYGPAINYWNESNNLHSKACARFLKVEDRRISLDEPDLHILKDIVEQQNVLAIPQDGLGDK